jgi:hypothetical protein
MLNSSKQVNICECGDHCFSKITKGYTVIVSPEDAKLLDRNKWSSKTDKHSVYAQRSALGKTVRLHREIMRPPVGHLVDHINGNGLDNRRSNLRLATHAQNSVNRINFRKSKRGFIGVYRAKKRWQAMINTEQGHIHLGSYTTPEEAAKVRDAAAFAKYGEFAQLNFPLRTPPAGEVAR